MTQEVLFGVAVLVFFFLLLGVGLTVYEFKYFILGQKYKEEDSSRVSSPKS